jgi:uncharacterized integral membrane protein
MTANRIIAAVLVTFLVLILLVLFLVSNTEMG